VTSELVVPFPIPELADFLDQAFRIGAIPEFAYLLNQPFGIRSTPEFVDFVDEPPGRRPAWVSVAW
jgi:hypothetical protein